MADEILKDKESMDRAIKTLDFNNLGEEIVIHARNNHRYENRTGNLNRSVKHDKSTIYIDDTMAKYGKYIHDGFKSWIADPFIDKAVEKVLSYYDIKIALQIEEKL